MAYNYTDKTGLLYVLTKLKDKLFLKVDKVEGKGLSTNDYSDEEKAKVAEIENKAPLVNPTFTGIPQAPTPSTGSNDKQIANTEFVTSAIATAIGGVSGIRFEIVEELPATGEQGVFYLIDNSSGTGNSYDEYIWINNSWEKIGTTNVDLSSYVKTTDMVPITTAEIDAMFSDW